MEDGYCFIRRESSLESNCDCDWDLVSDAGTVCSHNTECSEVKRYATYRDALLAPVVEEEDFFESESRCSCYPTSVKRHRPPESIPCKEQHGDSEDLPDSGPITPKPRGYMKGDATLGYRRSAGNGSRCFCRCSGCVSILAMAKAGAWPDGKAPPVRAAGGRKASREYLLYSYLDTGSREKEYRNKSSNKRCRRRENKRLIKEDQRDV